MTFHELLEQFTIILCFLVGDSLLDAYEVLFIINTFEDNGYETYAVGGCARDAVLGKEPKDWDICTPALPEQTMQCFDGHASA